MPEELVYRAEEPAVTVAQASQESTIPGAGRRARGKWSTRLSYVLAFAALSVFVVAIAHIIGAFPWLSIFLSLPLLLYLIEKRGL